jgi:hypothetical protein
VLFGKQFNTRAFATLNFIVTGKYYVQYSLYENKNRRTTYTNRVNVKYIYKLQILKKNVRVSCEKEKKKKASSER